MFNVHKYIVFGSSYKTCNVRGLLNGNLWVRVRVTFMAMVRVTVRVRI